MRETHFDGTRAGKNFTLDRQVEPLVLESEISGLADLHAYMKYQNFVTRFSFPYFDMPEVTKGFELRERPEEKLPYQPDPEHDGEPKRELELVPEEPGPARPNTPSETQQIEPAAAIEQDAEVQQSLNMRG